MEAAASISAFVTLGPQLIKCVIAITQLWNQVKDVPADIRNRVEDLGCVGDLFQEIEEEFKNSDLPPRFWNTSSGKQTIGVSRQAYKALNDLVQDLNRQLEARRGNGPKAKVTALKVVLKKDALEKLEKRLERSLWLLQLSMDAYHRALTRHIPELVTNKISANLSSRHDGLIMPRMEVQDTKLLVQGFEKPTTDTRISAKPRPHSGRNYRSTVNGPTVNYTQKTGAWKAEVRFPAWVSQKTFALHCATAMAGWNIHCRVYNVVPDDAEIVRMVRHGDRMGVMRLFSSRAASPFDKTANRRSLLYYAAEQPQYEMCQLLLQHGLRDALEDPFAAESPVTQLRKTERRTWARARSASQMGQQTELSQTVTLFRTHLQDPGAIPAEGLLNGVSQYALDDDIATFQKLFMPDYCDLLLNDRLEIVRLGAFNVWDPLTLKRLLSPGTAVERSHVRQSTSEKLSLVHSAAVALGCRFPDTLKTQHDRETWIPRVYSEDWGMFVKSVATVSDIEDLHSMELIVPWAGLPVPVWTGTPLTSLIGGVLCYISLEVSLGRWDSILQATLHYWLEILHSAGVNLEEYGRRELRLLHQEEQTIKGAFDANAIESSRGVDRKRLLNCSRFVVYRPRIPEPREMTNRVPIRILDLQTGPSPGDWQIVWAPEIEYMAGQFWNTIEDIEIAMPGGWIDG